MELKLIDSLDTEMYDRLTSQLTQENELISVRS
jgi:hypothetical protein